MIAVWQPTTIGNEIELAYGKSLPAYARRTGTIPVFGSNGRVGIHDASLVDGPGIIVGRKGSVGAVLFSEAPFWPIDTTYFVVNKGDHDWRFLFYLLDSLGLTKLNSHSAVPGLNREDVYCIEASFPSTPEQTMIARVLDLVSHAIALEERALSSTEALKQSAMHDVFTRGLRGEAQVYTEFGPVPASWPLLSIGALGRVVTGSTPPTRDIENYQGGTIPFVTPGDIEHGVPIVRTERCITEQGLAVSRPLPAGATCVVCIGATIGKVGLTTSVVCATNQQINAVVPSAAFDAGYVFHLLTHWSDYIRKHGSPSPVPILSKGAFERIEIYVAPDPGEQQHVTSLLDAIDRKAALHKRKRALLQELFRTLVSKLISGELRVADLNLRVLDQPNLSASLLSA